MTARGIAADLSKILRKGLPIRSDIRLRTVMRLAAIQQRANNPDERGSRLKALDSLLRWQVARLEKVELRAAAALLFGISTEAAGTTLMRRRTMAAAASGYEVNHFRKRIEPRIISTLAWQFRKVSDEHSETFTTPPRLSRAKGKTQPPPPDVFAWETFEHQEFICRIWANVYALRSALLNVQRLISMERPRDETRRSIVGALWRTAVMIHLDAEYHNSYGGTLLSDGSTVRPVDLIRLAGWTPDISSVEADSVYEQVVKGDGITEFASRIHTSAEIERVLCRWEREFGAPEESRNE